MVFLKLFLICMFKDPNLVENLTNLAEILLKKLNYAEFMELVFLSLPSCTVLASQRCEARGGRGAFTHRPIYLLTELFVEHTLAPFAKSLVDLTHI